MSEDLFLKTHRMIHRRALVFCLALSLIFTFPLPSAAEDVPVRRPVINLNELPDPSQFDHPESTDPAEETPEASTPQAETPAAPAAPTQTQPAGTKPTVSVPVATEPQETGAAVNNPGAWVPQYYQTDYPNVPYGSGTVATSGCSMTCMAMVVSALTGQKVTPDNLANRFRNADGSHVQRMEAIATIYDIKYTKTFAMYDVVNALKAGKLVVEMVSSPSPFSKTQHLILLTGINEDGKIFVNDPMGSNREKRELKYGLTYGFDQGFLSYGFSGAWIFEPMKFPENVHSNYPDLQLSQDDKDILAKLIWLEARGERFEGQQAVAEVVLNRLVSDKFPGVTLRAIIYAEDQFTTTKFIADTTADELQYKAIERALSGPNVLPTDVFYFARHAVNKNTWGRIGKHVFCRAF